MFLDPAWVVTVLTPLLSLPAHPVRQVQVLGSPRRSQPGQVILNYPTLSVVPTSSTMAGPPGRTAGRTLTSTFDILFSVEQLAAADVSALALIGTYRRAVYDLLEGLRPSADWGPVLYQRGQLLSIEPPVFTWIDSYAAERGLSTCPHMYQEV
jgi:hypothetical protein